MLLQINPDLQTWICKVGERILDPELKAQQNNYPKTLLYHQKRVDIQAETINSDKIGILYPLTPLTLSAGQNNLRYD